MKLLVMEGFHYPENPAWSMQKDEIQGNVSIDPEDQELAGFILRHVFSEIQKASPGRRIEISFEDWDTALIRARRIWAAKKDPASTG